MARTRPRNSPAQPRPETSTRPQSMASVSSGPAGAAAQDDVRGLLESLQQDAATQSLRE